MSEDNYTNPPEEQNPDLMEDNEPLGKLDAITGVITEPSETFEKIGIPEQFNDIFFVQLAQNLEGYEKKLEKIYYGPIKK